MHGVEQNTYYNEQNARSRHKAISFSVKIYVYNEHGYME